MKPTHYAISDLSTEFAVTRRTLRFYEEKGLLQPHRTTGNHRRYSSRDRARLKLILRGKRFGYTLDEIAKMIGLGDVNVDEIDQIRNALVYGDKKLCDIRRRIQELNAMEQDMLRVRKKLSHRLKEIEGKNIDV